MQGRVLLIDDDQGIAEAVSLNLRTVNCELEHVANGQQGLKRALEGDFDLVVIDVMLPDLNGFDICRLLRQAKPKLPILFLTACADEVDVVLGLEHGGDDYLSKPFRVREFVARVRSLMRRAAEAPSPIIEHGPLRIDTGARKAWLKTAELELTTIEFDLLVYFASRNGITISRDNLLANIWGYTAGDYDGTVNSQLCKLRKKLSAELPDHEFIVTLRGFGYRFEAPVG